MKKYRIRTIAGGGLAFFLGGSIITFEIQEINTQRKAYYTLIGADFGFGLSTGGGGGISSWTSFQANQNLNEFEGYVTVLSASAMAVGGISGMDMNFVTGKAAGLKINGVGWATGAGVSAVATHGWFEYRN